MIAWLITFRDNIFHYKAMSELKKELEYTKDELQKTKGETKYLKQILDNSLTENADLLQKLMSAQATEINLRNLTQTKEYTYYPYAEIQELSRKNRALYNENESLLEEKARLKAELDSKIETYNTLLSKMKIHENSLNAAAAVNKTLAKNAEKSNEITRLRSVLREKEEMITRLKATTTDAEKQAVEINLLQEKIKKLEADYQAVKEEQKTNYNLYQTEIETSYNKMHRQTQELEEAKKQSSAFIELEQAKRRSDTALTHANQELKKLKDSEAIDKAMKKSQDALKEVLIKVAELEKENEHIKKLLKTFSEVANPESLTSEQKLAHGNHLCLAVRAFLLSDLVIAKISESSAFYKYNTQCAEVSEDFRQLETTIEAYYRIGTKLGVLHTSLGKIDNTEKERNFVFDKIAVGSTEQAAKLREMYDQLFGMQQRIKTANQIFMEFKDDNAELQTYKENIVHAQSSYTAYIKSFEAITKRSVLNDDDKKLYKDMADFLNINQKPIQPMPRTADSFTSKMRQTLLLSTFDANANTPKARVTKVESKVSSPRSILRKGSQNNTEIPITSTASSPEAE